MHANTTHARTNLLFFTVGSLFGTVAFPGGYLSVLRRESKELGARTWDCANQLARIGLHNPGADDTDTKVGCMSMDGCNTKGVVLFTPCPLSAHYPLSKGEWWQVPDVPLAMPYASKQT